jgi:hypothetical protein
MDILNEERGECILPVYRANAEPDLQGDVIGPADLFAAMGLWAERRQLGVEHDGNLPDGLVTILGSYMTGDKAYKGDGFSAKPLTWLLHLKIDLGQPDGKKLWDRLKHQGGLSIGGTATPEEFITEAQNEAE